MPARCHASLIISRPPFATLTIFGDDLLLGPDAQEELLEERSRDADRVDLDGIAYVRPGTKARAVSANIDDVGEGLSWAQSL